MSFAIGWWCRLCEFFEEADFSEEDDVCQGCGCLRANHSHAKVVEA